MDAIRKHRAIVSANPPGNGSISMMIITESEYKSIKALLGNLTKTDGYSDRAAFALSLLFSEKAMAEDRDESERKKKKPQTRLFLFGGAIRPKSEPNTASMSCKVSVSVTSL